MEQTGITENVIKEIRDLAEKYHLDKVILFGSRARGDYKRNRPAAAYYVAAGRLSQPSAGKQSYE